MRVSPEKLFCLRDKRDIRKVAQEKETEKEEKKMSQRKKSYDSRDGETFRKEIRRKTSIVRNRPRRDRKTDITAARTSSLT